MKLMHLHQNRVLNGHSLSALIIISGLVWAIFYALNQAINLPTVHIDGAFQTASGLYRLDVGQHLGQDFYPYLGIGLLTILYPLFKLAGADLAASVFAAQFLILIAGTLTTALIWHLVWKPSAFLTSLSIASLLFLMPIALCASLSIHLPSPLRLMVDPGPSLRPVRAFLPYFAALIYYLILRKVSNVSLRYTLSGVLTGLLLLWSNDFALPSFALFGLLNCIVAYTHKELTIKNACIYLVSIVITWFVLMMWLTNGQPLALLSYNFRDVAQDQWWFFGPYAPSARVFDASDLMKLVNRESLFPLTVFSLLAIHVYKVKTVQASLLLWIGAVLFLGGTLASVGGHFDGYYAPFAFWAKLITAVVILRFVYLKIDFFKSVASQQFLVIKALCLASILLLTAFSIQQFQTNWQMAKSDAKRFYVKELGGFLTTEWQPYISLARNTQTKAVYEEYWGIWSATKKIFTTWRVDSVIHALGETRIHAKDQLKHAELMVTTSKSLSPEWQPWSVSQNYWFYAALLKDWAPIGQYPNTVVWQKMQSPRLIDKIDCQLTNTAKPTIVFNAQAPGLYAVSMHYQVLAKGRVLAMVKNNLSYAMDTQGYVSINPKAQQTEFPAYVESAGLVSLDTKIVGNSASQLKIQSCSVQYFSTLNAQELSALGLNR